MADHDGAVGLVEVAEALRCAGCWHESRKSCGQIRLGKSDGLGSLGRRGHGRNNEVNFAGFERGDETGKGDIFNNEGPSETAGESSGQLDRDAGRRAVRSDRFEGGVGKFHPHAERDRFGCGKRDGGEKEKQAAHPVMSVVSAIRVNNSVFCWHASGRSITYWILC